MNYQMLRLPLMVNQGLGSFAEATNPVPPPNADQISAQMDKVVSALRSAIIKTKINVDATVIAQGSLISLIPILGPFMANESVNDSTAALSSALATMTNITNRLDGPDRAAVLAGRLDPQKWLKAAKTIQQGIYGIGQTVKDSGPATNLWNTIQDAEQQINQWLTTAAKAAGDTLGWLKWALPVTLAGGIAIALLLNPAAHAAVRVTQKATGLSGTNSRRRRRRRSRR